MTVKIAAQKAGLSQTEQQQLRNNQNSIYALDAQKAKASIFKKFGFGNEKKPISQTKC
jgi:adenylylsulfate kinase-like enzyme